MTLARSTWCGCTDSADFLPGNPAQLAERGVGFALTTHDLDSPATLWERLRTAAAHGLSDQEAVAALTERPADSYGLGDRLARIEQGRLAYLTVVRGEGLFDPGAEVAMTSVDGRPHVIERAGETDGADTPEDEEASVVPTVVARSPLDDRGPFLEPETIIVRNATVWTSIDAGVLDDADRLVRDGRIVAAGSAFADWWAYKIEVYDAIPHAPTVMDERGVPTTANSDSPDLARRMNTEAAKSVRSGGMDEQRALNLVTIDAAQQLGADERIGSIEPGEDADFVVSSHHPLSTRAVAEQTWLDGALYWDRAGDTERREAIAAERAALTALASESDDGGGSSSGSDDGDAGHYEMPLELYWATLDEACSAEHVQRRGGSPMKMLTAILGLLLAVAPARAERTVLTGATVFPVSSAPIENGEVITDDGVITTWARPAAATAAEPRWST